MKTIRTGVLLLLVSSLASAAAAQGVQTGALRGTVIDPQQLPMPGVAVTVTSSALQGERTTTTGMDGAFALTLLPPGEYQVQFMIQGFSPEKRDAIVPLGAFTELTVALSTGPVIANVTVVATPAPVATASTGLNIQQREVEALATSRNLRGIATLAPGVTERTPGQNASTISISGAPSFDNLFMVNGVDVNDNITGAPQNLFIEEAIQETQVISSGVSAEYGRFSGGIVNAITKSGGNTFSGSFRLNLTNPAWTDETPFEEENDVTRESTTNVLYEGTFGGPIVKNRVWFFGAGRRENRSTDRVLDVTGLSYTSKDENWRAEGKVTATVLPSQTVQGGFVTNPRTLGNLPAFPDAIDPATLGDQDLPNWYLFGNYRGALSSRFLAEAQYSERRWRAEFTSGVSSALNDSPIFGLSETSGFYNGPYFDPSDPEERNNRQLTGSATYVADGAGQHELKAGYEWFRSQNVGGNSQSASGYVFDADYLTNAAGDPVLDSQGRLIPVFVPGETLLETWMATPGAVLNVDTSSIYARDHWRINRLFTADLGFRYEHVSSEATAVDGGVNTNTIVPRLALAYDPTGSGRVVFHSTYAHYAGRYNENLFGKNSNVGHPNNTFGVYEGPAGQGRSFAAGFNPDNYATEFGEFPSANVFFDEGLSAPLTKEFTVSGGTTAGARAHLDATYVWRRTSDLIEDFIELDNGTTDVISDDGVDLGEFTNRVYRNSDIPERNYQALLFEGRYQPHRDVTVQGAWTVQLQNDGNYEGEELGEPAATSIIGDYPEAFNAARHYPTGRLQTFQRHRVRLWSIYDKTLGRHGQLSASGLWRFESGRVYSLVATNQRLTNTQLNLLSDYVDAPASQNVFFDERGSETFPSYALLDLSLSYSLPVYGSLRPWIKFDVFNVFNNDKLISYDTTVLPDPTSPVDALGLRTGYRTGTNFGNARSANDYPRSLADPGGRTFRLAFGVRF